MNNAKPRSSFFSHRDLLNRRSLAHPLPPCRGPCKIPPSVVDAAHYVRTPHGTSKWGTGSSGHKAATARSKLQMSHVRRARRCHPPWRLVLQPRRCALYKYDVHNLGVSVALMHCDACANDESTRVEETKSLCTLSILLTTCCR